jgi:AraC-like DNA-binding protein
MRNWKLSSKNLHVAKYVECYWFLEKDKGDAGNKHPKLNPDPSAHLIIASSHQKYQYDQGSIIQKGSGNHWIFPHRNTLTMDHSSPFQIIGIKFKVGALYSLELPISGPKLEKVASVDIKQLIDLNLFNPESLLIYAVKHPQVVSDMLDEVLVPWVSMNQEDRHSELVRHILPLLGHTPIAQIGALLHRSQRTVERSFLRVTDLTLKQCQAMIRLEEILNFCFKLNNEDINWADLAAKFKFSDQPHLIRYLRNSIGKTPGEYSQQRDLAIDTYGDFEFH